MTDDEKARLTAELPAILERVAADALDLCREVATRIHHTDTDALNVASEWFKELGFEGVHAAVAAIVLAQMALLASSVHGQWSALMTAAVETSVMTQVQTPEGWTGDDDASVWQQAMLAFERR